MRILNRPSGSGVLCVPWIITATVLALIAVIVVSTNLVPWGARAAVNGPQLPLARYVPAEDCGWDATPAVVITLDSHGGIWAGESEPVEVGKIESVLRRYRTEVARYHLARGHADRWFGVVKIRAHRDVRWSEVQGVVAAARDVGYGFFVFECRSANGNDRVWLAVECWEYAVAEYERSVGRERLGRDPATLPRWELRSTDQAVAERDRDKLRKLRSSAEHIEPVIGVRFPAHLSMQQAVRLFECYLHPQLMYVEVSGLTR